MNMRFSGHAHHQPLASLGVARLEWCADAPDRSLWTYSAKDSPPSRIVIVCIVFKSGDLIGMQNALCVNQLSFDADLVGRCAVKG